MPIHYGRNLLRSKNLHSMCLSTLWTPPGVFRSRRRIYLLKGNVVLMTIGTMTPNVVDHTLGGGVARAGGRLVSKSVSSNSLGGAQAHGPPRRGDGGGAEGVGGVDSARSGATGDGKSSKWQFKFELSGLAAPSVVACGSGSANTSSVGTAEVASQRAPGVKKEGDVDKAGGG